MADYRKESLAWDRIGRLLQQSAASTQQASARGLDVWGSVSRHLKSENYTADNLADDTVRGIASAAESMWDMWSLWTRGPREEGVAHAVPTAFLFFDRTGKSKHKLVDAVKVEVNPEDLGDRSLPLPEFAEVALNGMSIDGVDKLTSCIRAKRNEDNAYLYDLVAVNYVVGDSGTGLVAGVYDGVVYLNNPVLALANLRVVVDGPPPEVDPTKGEPAATEAGDHPDEPEK